MKSYTHLEPFNLYRATLIVSAAFSDRRIYLALHVLFLTFSLISYKRTLVIFRLTVASSKLRCLRNCGGCGFSRNIADVCSMIIFLSYV